MRPRAGEAAQALLRGEESARRAEALAWFGAAALARLQAEESARPRGVAPGRAAARVHSAGGLAPRLHSVGEASR